MNYINIDAKSKNKSKNSSKFRVRGNYITNVKDGHEKVELFWTENCIAGSDINDIALINKEIELVQARNSRVKNQKSLHVVMSLKGETIPEEAWRDADALLAKKLGLQEHQRIAALHKDTENSHLHIVYNLIHPETFKKASPFQDFKTGAEVCREMEEKYDLKRDVGYKEAQHNDTRSQGAKDMEAHTFHQSFESFVLEQKKSILAGVAKAKDWHDVHEIFAKHDLRLKTSGAGLAIVQGKNRMKASTLDRNMSKNRLEKRFGKFKAKSRSHKKIVSSRKKYSLMPRFPLRGEGLRMWGRYLGIKKRDRPLLTFKDYLMLEAGFDPLAMALIKANQRFINGLLPKKQNSKIMLPSVGNRLNKQPLEMVSSIKEAVDIGAFEENALTVQEALDSLGTKKDSGFEIN